MRAVKFNGESLLEEHVVPTDLDIIHKRSLSSRVFVMSAAVVAAGIWRRECQILEFTL